MSRRFSSLSSEELGALVANCREGGIWGIVYQVKQELGLDPEDFPALAEHLASERALASYDAAAATYILSAEEEPPKAPKAPENLEPGQTPRQSKATQSPVGDDAAMEVLRAIRRPTAEGGKQGSKREPGQKGDSGYNIFTLEQAPEKKTELPAGSEPMWKRKFREGHYELLGSKALRQVQRSIWKKIIYSAIAGCKRGHSPAQIHEYIQTAYRQVTFEMVWSLLTALEYRWAPDKDATREAVRLLGQSGAALEATLEFVLACCRELLTENELVARASEVGLRNRHRLRMFLVRIGYAPKPSKPATPGAG